MGSQIEVLESEVRRLRAELEQLEQQNQQTRRQLEAERALLDAFLNASPVGHCILDRDLRYQHINTTLATLNGQTPEMHLGHTVQEMLPPHMLPQVEPLLRSVLQTRQPVLNAELSGRTHHVLASFYPVWNGDGNVLNIGVTVTEITRRKEEEESLRQAKQSIETESQAKDRLFAEVSHELRTPLTPMLMSASAMETDPNLPLHVRQQIGMIRHHIELEARLVDDLLDLARMSRGKLQLQLQIVDVHDLLHRTVQLVQSDAPPSLRITTDLAATRHHVRADPMRLQQVFWNLLRNAVKFTPETGSIQVRSELDDQSVLQVHVQDTGIGIEPHILPRLFNAFEQGSASTSRRFGGLGLGLSISKALMDLHGGTISARSPGRGLGATFTVTLSTLSEAEIPAAAHAPNEPQATAAPVSCLRILLVEDHRATARIIAQLLQELGHRVTIAGTMQAALTEATSEPFDLLVCDLGLPDGNGLDLMRQFRQRQAIKGIALSGYGMEEDIARSREAGFAEHLIKPINFQRLEQAIREVCG